MNMQPVWAEALRGGSSASLQIGTAALGNLYRPVDDVTAADVVGQALVAGVRSFDTAPRYGFGLAERRLGAALAGVGRDSYFLSTKVGRLLVPAPGVRDHTLREGFASAEPFREVFDYGADGIRRSIEESLLRLRLERLDLAYLHDLGAATHGTGAGAAMQAALDGGYRALRDLQADGVVGAVGLGVNEVEVCLDMLARVPLDQILLAGRYTLLDQSALDRLLPLCEATGTRVAIGGAFNSGILAVGSAGADPRYDYAPAPPAIVSRVRAIEAVCTRHDVPLPAAALQFPAAHPAVVSVIPGVANRAELDAALAWWNHPVPAAFWADLKDEGLLRADAPTP